MNIYGITTGQDYVHFGNRSDVCTICLREKAKSDFISSFDAEKRLKGTFEGKKLLKIPISGTSLTLCMDHLHKFSDENREVSDNEQTENAS